MKLHFHCMQAMFKINAEVFKCYIVSTFQINQAYLKSNYAQ